MNFKFVHERAGVTLLEALVALGILALLATLIMSGLTSFRETAALNQAVDETLELLREARAKTLGSEGGISHGVRFQPSAVTGFRTGVYNPSDPVNVVVNLPDLVEMAGHTLNTTTDSVSFERLSGAAKTCGTIQFRTKRRSFTKRIQIFPSGLAVVGSSALVSSGSYVGNGADDRIISGVGFGPDFVLVKGDADREHQWAMARTSTMPGDLTKHLAGSHVVDVNQIQSLASGSFTIGSDAHINDSGVTYYWIAFSAAPGELKVGSYTGNSGSSQSITGVGFQPEYVIVMAAATREAVHRSSTMSLTYFFEAESGEANRITGFDADGFSVGNSSRVNQSGITYHYIAWNAKPGVMAVGSYVGGGLDNRAITGVGFQPEYVIIREAASTETAHKSRATGVSVDSTMDFRQSENDPNEIQKLLPDGFEVGTDQQVNASGRTYHWVAFAGLGAGCP